MRGDIDWSTGLSVDLVLSLLCRSSCSLGDLARATFVRVGQMCHYEHHTNSKAGNQEAKSKLMSSPIGKTVVGGRIECNLDSRTDYDT